MDENENNNDGSEYSYDSDSEVIDMGACVSEEQNVGIQCLFGTNTIRRSYRRECA